MYVMRRATQGDIPALAELIHARAHWMLQRGLDEGADLLTDDRANQIAAQAGDGLTPVWALTDKTGALMGCTSLYDETPHWGWTDAERAEPAYFLATTFTHPARRQERPGTLIAWWAVDYAAREVRDWVRRGCGHQALVRYYRGVQGFELVHSTERHGHPAYLLARKAEELPVLPVRTIE
ncbi:GNAT family N-acetyltransferase [Streptomyces sp. MAR4 CNY-716]